VHGREAGRPFAPADLKIARYGLMAVVATLLVLAALIFAVDLVFERHIGDLRESIETRLSELTRQQTRTIKALQGSRGMTAIPREEEDAPVLYPPNGRAAHPDLISGTAADCSRARTQGFLIGAANASVQAEAFKALAVGSWMVAPTQPPTHIMVTNVDSLDGHYQREGELLLLMKGVLRTQIAVDGKALMVDAGANHGTYALLAAALGARVVAIEPQRTLVGNIVASVERNHLLRRVHLYNNAILDTRAAVGIASGDRGADGGIATVVEGGDLCALPLDDLILGREVTFLKVDVEGNDLRALRSAHQAYRSGHVRNVLVEFGPPKRWREVAQQSDRDGVNTMQAMHRLGFSTWLAPSQCTDTAMTELDLPRITAHGVRLARLSPSHFRPLVNIMDVTGAECYLFWTLDKY